MDRFRDPGREEWSGEQSRRLIRWRWWMVMVIVREEIGILMPADGRCHRMKTRVVELPAVPQSSFAQRLVSAIAVKTTVTLGAADQLVHVAGLYPKVGLVCIHSRGHEPLERRREHP